MNEYSTIIQSVVTEKSSDLQSIKKYTFLVQPRASKTNIKKAIKAIYGAEVSSIRTIITPKKTRFIKGKYLWAKRPNLKKAIVTLKNNQTIDPNKLGEVNQEKKTPKTK